MSKYDSIGSHTEPEKKSMSNVLIWGFGILILMAFFTIMLVYKPVPLDKATQCAESPPKHLAVLIDLSDPLNPSQLESLKKRFDLIMHGGISKQGMTLSKGDKLSVYYMTSSNIPKRVFQACSSGTLDEANSLVEGSALIKEKWRLFNSNIENEIEFHAANPASLSSSPIIESLGYIRSKEFPPSGHSYQKNQKRELIVISDFLQNSSLLSHYDSKPWLSAAAVNKKFPVQLRGIDSNILFVVSPIHRNLQDKKLKFWWREYFNVSVTGGQLVSWSNL